MISAPHCAEAGSQIFAGRMAPEVLLNLRCTAKADTYSLGTALPCIISQTSLCHPALTFSWSTHEHAVAECGWCVLKGCMR